MNIIGPISFAQESIWLDELFRFRTEDDSSAVYHIVLVFYLALYDDDQDLFMSRLRSSLRLVWDKHASLRTCFYNDKTKGVQQRILSSETIDTEIRESWITSNDELLDIILDEETNRSHFNLVQGRVTRCHLIHQNNDINN